jgi:hypothetical protein
MHQSTTADSNCRYKPLEGEEHNNDGVMSISSQLAHGDIPRTGLRREAYSEPVRQEQLMLCVFEMVHAVLYRQAKL